MKHCSIIIPAYNEEKGIAHVLDALREAMPHAEIIVVNDASTDNTAAVAEGKGATVVTHPTNAGYGRSLKDGILAATHDTIVISDADGSYPIDRIQDLLDKMDEGFDMVVGARSGKAYRGSFLKMPARIVLKFLVEFTTGKRIPDINSGLRVFKKSTALQFFPDLCEGFSFTTTITLVYMLTGKFVTYLPIAYHKRVGRSKVRIIRDSLMTLQYITEAMATYNPLKLYLLLSGIAFFTSLLLFTLSFWIWMSAMIALSAASFFAAWVLFGMGFQAYSSRKSSHA